MKNITFINAGAGSGKTFRLTEELYSAINKNECNAEEVLLTTFTKKAASEIKVKAREKLLSEGKYNEANNLQNAYIGTVHSVGQQIIQKFWHYIDFPKEINVMDENDTNFYFSQAIAYIPSDEELKEIVKLNYRFSPLTSSYGSLDTEKWKNDLLKIIETARTNNISDFSYSKKASKNYIEKVFNSNEEIIDYKSLVLLIDEIVKIGENLVEAGNKGRKTAAKKIAKIDTSNIKYKDILDVIKVVADFEKKNLLDGVEVPDIESFYRSKTLLEDIERYNNLLFDIASRSIDKYDKYKKEIGLIDYSDMENGFLKLLNIEEVQNEINNTIKLVMVDEFQDSSPIQLAIFIKLSEIVARSIWVGDPKQSIYGFRGTDPILIDSIINKFEKTTDKSSLLTDNLEYSWRSRPSIVDSVNKIFKPALKDQIKEDNIELTAVRTDSGFVENNSSLHHFNLIEVNEKGKPDTKKYHKAVAKAVVKILNEDIDTHTWSVSDKYKSKPNKDKSKETVKIKRIKANDIAILCKANETVSAISKELIELGVKVSSENYELQNTSEYYLIMALIKLVLSKQNTLAKAEIKILTDSNYSVADLIDERLKFISDLPKYPERLSLEEKNKDIITKYKDEKSAYFDLLNNWGIENLLIKDILSVDNEVKELPVPQLIEYLIHKLDLYSVVTKWDNAEQRQANLQKIIEYAYNYDERCLKMSLGASISGFIYYLQSQDSLVESVSNSDDAVNVLTYHKSKGLEWPTVILTDIQKDVNWGFVARNIFGITIEEKENIDLENILENRNIISVPWVFGTMNTTVSDDFMSFIENTDEYTQAKRKHNNELKRVLYVGMTRSRDYLITTMIADTMKFTWLDIVNDQDEWSFGEYTKRGEGDHDIYKRGFKVMVHNLTLLDEVKVLNHETNIYFKGKTIDQETTNEPYFISPSKVENKIGVKVNLYKNINARIATNSSVSGKEDILGNCLHDIFYLYLGSKINEVSIDCSDAENIIKNHQLQKGIDAKEIVNSIDKLYNFLRTEFGPVEWYREIPLEVLIDGQLYKGEADLLLETKEGFILIDFKSYLGSMEKVLKKSVNNDTKSFYAGKYSAQLNTYVKIIEANFINKKVIKKMIYYTILGQLVEVE